MVVWESYFTMPENHYGFFFQVSNFIMQSTFIAFLCSSMGKSELMYSLPAAWGSRRDGGAKSPCKRGSPAEIYNSPSSSKNGTKGCGLRFSTGRQYFGMAGSRSNSKAAERLRWSVECSTFFFALWTNRKRGYETIFIANETIDSRKWNPQKKWNYFE